MKAFARRRQRPSYSGTAALQYFDARSDGIRKGLLAAQQYYDIEGIHDLRVETKRLRALFHLVKAIDPDFKSGANRSGLKKTYAAAGVLRDIHVQQQRLLKSRLHLKLSEYYNALTAAELSARPDFEQAADAFSLRTLMSTEKRIRRAFQRTESADAVATHTDQFVSRLLLLVRRPKPSVPTLHDIRKASKELHYICEVRGDGHATTSASARAIKILKPIHQALGRWRDTKLMSRSIRKFLAADRAKRIQHRAAYRDVLRKLDDDASMLLERYRRGSARLSSLRELLRP